MSGPSRICGLVSNFVRMSDPVTLLRQHPRQVLAYVGCLAAMLGLVGSKFLLTCAMVLLLLVGLVSRQYRDDWARLRAQPHY